MTRESDLFDLPLFDLARGREERDKGMAQVEDPSLADQLDAMLCAHVGIEVTGEDVRVLYGDEPHHPNAWGPAIAALVRRGRLEKTGEHRQMKRVSSHARSNPVYRVVS